MILWTVGVPHKTYLCHGYQRITANSNTYMYIYIYTLMIYIYIHWWLRHCRISPWIGRKRCDHFHALDRADRAPSDMIISTLFYPNHHNHFNTLAHILSNIHCLCTELDMIIAQCTCEGGELPISRYPQYPQYRWLLSIFFGFETFWQASFSRKEINKTF